MRSRLPLIALISLLAFACDASDGDGDDRDGGAGGTGGQPTAGEPIDIDALTTGYGEFACDFVERCGQTDFGFNIIRQLVEDGGDCDAYFAAVYRNFVDRPAELAELRYDARAFDRCRSTALDTCQFGDEIPACEDAVRGRRAAGEPCPDSTLCAPGLYCDRDALADGECRHVCTARRAPGEPCDTDEECSSTGEAVGFCRRADALADGVCATLTLRGGAAVDAPCGLVSEADGFARVTCAAGAYCDADGDQSTGTCQDLPGPGEACEEGTPCEEGLCITGSCLVLDIISEPGGGCDLAQRRFCNLIAGLVCVDGTCVATQGQAGQPCSDGDLAVFCQPGLYCTDDGLCAAALADGEACDPDGPTSTCQSGACNPGLLGAGTCGPDTDPCL